MPLTFLWSDSVAAQAATTFTKHERRIRARLPHVEIRHTGGTSLPGVLTTGDVDLHVRTDGRSFETARDALCELYEPLHAETWREEAAFFFAPDSEPSIEIALTVIGSLDDLHHGEAWERIAVDPNLIESYNALKRSHEGGSIDEYQAAKGAFFREIFRL